MPTSVPRSLLDRFHSPRLTDPEQQARARVVASFGLMWLILCFVGFAICAVNFGTANPAWMIALGEGAATVVALALLRRSTTAGLATLVGGQIVGSLLVALYLGGIRSPNLVFLAMPSLLAALAGERRIAVGSALATALAVTGLYVASVLRLPLPAAPVDAAPELTALMVCLVHLACLGTLALLYESSRIRLMAKLRAETERHEQVETQQRLAQKLESVGQLAAGIAHEINNPLQYAHDSVQFIGQSVPVLTAVLEGYRDVARGVASGSATAADAAQALQRENDADVGFVLENLPDSIDRAQDGLERVAAVVRSVRAFAGQGQEPRRAVDLNDAVLSTLTLAQSEYRDVARVETDLGELPRVTCWSAEVNLALLAIVENAAHAVAARVKHGAEVGRISVRTRREGDEAVVSIADTGAGIAPEIHHRIFDPFFSTKGVGAGVGQGLSLAWAVIVERHGGKLTFESELGRGTTFNVRLPITA